MAQQMCTIARAVAAGGRFKGSVFGPCAREVQQHRDRRLRARIADSEACVVAEDRALEVVEHGFALGLSVREMIRSARSTAVARRRVQRESDQFDAEALTWFAQNRAGPDSQAVSQILGPNTVVAVFPGAAANLVHIVDDGVQAATSACGVALARKMHHNGFAANLKRHWDQMHMTLLQEACHPLGPAKPSGAEPALAKKAVEIPSCRSVGFCICSEQGKVRFRLRNAILLRVRQACPPKSAMRCLLVDGFLALRFVAPVDDGHVGPDGAEFWFHLGLSLLNPWKVSLHKMVPIADLGELPVGRFLYLRAIRV